MTPNIAHISDGKKFMWDGRVLQTREEALLVAESYRSDNFEARLVEQEGKFLVYSRRVVKEVAVTAQ